MTECVFHRHCTNAFVQVLKIQRSTVSHLFPRMSARPCGAQWKAFVALSWTLLQMGHDVVRRRWRVRLRKEGGRVVGTGFLGGTERALESSCLGEWRSHSQTSQGKGFYFCDTFWAFTRNSEGERAEAQAHTSLAKHPSHLSLMNVCRIYGQ